MNTFYRLLQNILIIMILTYYSIYCLLKIQVIYKKKCVTYYVVLHALCIMSLYNTTLLLIR